MFYLLSEVFKEIKKRKTHALKIAICVGNMCVVFFMFKTSVFCFSQSDNLLFSKHSKLRKKSAWETNSFGELEFEISLFVLESKLGCSVTSVQFRLSSVSLR